MDEFEFEFDDNELEPSHDPTPKKRSPGGGMAWTPLSSPSPKRVGYGSRKNRRRKDIKELDVIFSPEEPEEEASDPFSYTGSDDKSSKATPTPPSRGNDVSFADRDPPTPSAAATPVMLKGRTAKRRNRKKVRTGADAIKESEERVAETKETVAHCTSRETEEESHAVKSEEVNHEKEGEEKDSSDDRVERPRVNTLVSRRKKKRRLADLHLQLSKSNSVDSIDENDEGFPGGEESAAKVHEKRSISNFSDDNARTAAEAGRLPKVAANTPLSVPRGRRHKRPKASRSTPTSYSSWEKSEDSEFSNFCLPSVTVKPFSDDVSAPTIKKKEDSVSVHSQLSDASKSDSSGMSKPLSNSKKDGDVASNSSHMIATSHSSVLSTPTSKSSSHHMKTTNTAGSEGPGRASGSIEHPAVKSKSDDTSDEFHTPPSDSKSVRFSLSSNTSHFYEINSKKHYGTPPGSPDENATPYFASGSGSFKFEQGSVAPAGSFDDVKVSVVKKLSKPTSKIANGGAVETKKPHFGTVANGKSTSKAKAQGSSSNGPKHPSASKTDSKLPNSKNDHAKISVIEETLTKKLPPSCLKPKSTKFFPSACAANTLSTPDSSPSSRSSYSASSYGSSICRFTGTHKKKKHRSRRFNLGYSAKSIDDASEDINSQVETHSPNETPTVSLGRPGFSRDASAVQDAGNFRMLIDDLSYLCSAILQCKSKPGFGMLNSEVTCRHNSVTAGAACDLAEIVSQTETRTALMTLGAATARAKNGAASVGALGAVLEAIACAPVAIDVSEICREIMGVGCSDSGNNKPKPVESDCDAFPLKNASAIRSSFGRTKNSRQKTTGGVQLRQQIASSAGIKPIEERARYDGISCNALSLVVHFVGVDCVGSERSAVMSSGNINKASAKAARKSLLQHKSALHGLARLVADDPLVLAYLRKASLSRATADGYLDDSMPITNAASQSDDEESCSFFSSQTSELSTPSVLESKYDAPESSDPTKSGRRKGRKKKQPKLSHRSVQDFPSESLDPISEDHEFEQSDAQGSNEDPLSCLEGSGTSLKQSNLADLTPLQPRKLSQHHNLNGSGRSNCLDFLSEDSKSCSSSGKHPRTGTLGKIEKVELNSGQKFQEKIATAISRAKLDPLLVSSREEENECCFCSLTKPQLIHLGDDFGQSSQRSHPGKHGYMSSSNLALDALDCVVSGKDKSISSSDEDEDVLMNNEDAGDDEEDDDFLGINAENQIEDLMAKNPILYTNEMVRKSGSLPLLSKSMASTLAAILLCFKPDVMANNSNLDKPCPKCILYFHRRVSSLSGIIDNLCCLSPDVSKALSQKETLLLPSLLRVVSELSVLQEDDYLPIVDETILAALNTLTSLTHENPLACGQLLCSYAWDVAMPIRFIDKREKCSGSAQITGLEIIMSRLLKTVESKQRSRTAADGERPKEKSRYDSTILCLNILTNVVEIIPHPTKAIIAGMTVSAGSQSDRSPIHAVPWLSQWIVSKTSGFRNSVMKGSFGSADGEENNNNNSDSGLEVGEEGNLVTAGNGFVFLSYLMLNDDSPTTRTIQNTIIGELPIDMDGKSGGIQFMIKTMKAFCNFYHYSVGDLSVAVITPVVKLIAGLEKLDLTRNYC